jgi:hypothetical protein
MTTTEGQIETQLIEKLAELKYEIRGDIRDRDGLVKNFREKVGLSALIHFRAIYPRPMAWAGMESGLWPFWKHFAPEPGANGAPSYQPGATPQVYCRSACLAQANHTSNYR